MRNIGPSAPSPGTHWPADCVHVTRQETLFLVPQPQCREAKEFLASSLCETLGTQVRAGFVGGKSPKGPPLLVDKVLAVIPPIRSTVQYIHVLCIPYSWLLDEQAARPNGSYERGRGAGGRDGASQETWPRRCTMSAWRTLTGGAFMSQSP